MGARRQTIAEKAAQIGATTALEYADAGRERGDHESYVYWVSLARVAVDRTRASMLRRGVQMFTRSDRKGMTSA